MIIQDLERLELIEPVLQFGFAKGAEIYWLHRFINLEKNLEKSRGQIEAEIVDILRICSQSTFQKTMTLYNKIKPNLMSRAMKQKIEMVQDNPVHICE